MAFDGGFLYLIKQELLSAVDCHVDKIYQPSKDELVFLLRKKGFVKRLIMSAKPGSARVQFTEQKYENPQSPPMFCMLMRKYLSSARLVDIRQSGFERVIEFIFVTNDEMGDTINPKVVCELIGNQSNVILVNNERIIDSVRRSDIESSTRMIQPGAIYKYPNAMDKLDPALTKTDEIISKIIKYKELPLATAILNTVNGFSPLICRECAYLANSGELITDECDKNNIKSAINVIIENLRCGGNPTLVSKADGTPFDYTYVDIKQYGKTMAVSCFDSYSCLLDNFYKERELKARIAHSAQDIIHLINNLKARTEKKLALRLEDLKKCNNRDMLRIYGELIKANLFSLENGSNVAEVQNYYDENLQTIKIPMNPALTPSANAAKYFKDYKKSYTAEQTLTKLTEVDKKEIIYFESVLDNISRCETISDIQEIRTELLDAGYIKSSSKLKQKKSSNPVLREFRSSEGYKIVVGKNNVQNDYITTKLADKLDLWFHVKNSPGSHVVVFCGGGNVSDSTIRQAAMLAAINSKACASSQVPVDYTSVKYVKKPNGAKPGMVIYSSNKTIYVTPGEMKL